MTIETIRPILSLIVIGLILYGISRSREESREKHGMGLNAAPLPSSYEANYAAALGIDNATTRRLKAARALLPTPLQENISQGSLARLEEHLTQQRPELALAELESLGNFNPCPPAFWQEMAEAASDMWLTDQAARYREKAGLAFDLS